MLHQKHRARAGYTLLELLVVMAIIAMLAALSSAALFRLRSSSQVTRTNETLQKLDSAYTSQWSAAVDKIGRENPPEYLLLSLGNDKDLAKVVHLKLRLRQEFPEKVADLDMAALFPTTGNPAIDGLAAQIAANYRPKAVYTKHAALLSTMSVQDQNAILLNLVLDQARSGAGFNAESGVGSVGTQTVGQFKVFIDNWGRPIHYVRCAKNDAWVLNDNLWVSSQILGELNEPPYIAATTASTPNKRDPLDPMGLLQRPINPSVPTSQFPALAKQALNFWLGNVNDGSNRAHFIFSDGPDMKPFTLDELYSFRLKGTGKGD